MIEVVNWANSHAFGDSLAAHHRLRHKCFIERSGWDVPSHDGMEYDQFDTPAAIYLIRREAAGPVQGVVRLLPTTRPYMLQELWPDLLAGDVPSSPQVWEATRFGVDDDLEPPLKRRVALELVAGCLEFGQAQGIERYLVLSQQMILRRTIAAAGCAIRLLGESHTLASYPVVAAEIQVNAAALASARAKTGLHGSILRQHGADAAEAA